MNTREAIVLNTVTNLPVLDMDPVHLEVTQDGLAEGMSNALMTVVEVISDMEMDASVSYALVWSDDHRMGVRTVCARCEDVFLASDGCPGDMPGGWCAMLCSVCFD